MARKRAPVVIKEEPAAGEQRRHVRIELPPEEHAQLQKVARANGLSVTSFVRMAVLQRVRSELGGTK